MRELVSRTSRNSAASQAFAEARTGLFRATLLFGTIGLALAMIVIPAASKHGRQSGDEVQGLDLMTTGSISRARTSASGTPDVGPLRYSRENMDGKSMEPCLLFPDGTQRGAC